MNLWFGACRSRGGPMLDQHGGNWSLLPPELLLPYSADTVYGDGPPTVGVWRSGQQVRAQNLSRLVYAWVCARTSCTNGTGWSALRLSAV